MQMRAEGIARRPDGRKYRPPESERERDAMRTVLSARCRHAGVEDDDANRARLKDPDHGFAMGRLFVSGALLGEGEPRSAAIRRKEAAFALAMLDTRYRTVQGWPPRHAKAASYGDIRGEAKETGPETIRALRAAYSAADRAMGSLGVVARDMLDAAVIMDVDIPASPNAHKALRRALDVMADHFGR